jgi:hypothetical protein
MNVLEVMKEVGRRWKSLNPVEKSEFENKAKLDKKRFEQEMAEFSKEINKVSITSSDPKKAKSRVTKTAKIKAQSKSKRGRKRNTRSKQSDAQKDYYYPTRPINLVEEEEKEHEPENENENEEDTPKCDYLLRRRNRNKQNMFYSSESEASEESDSDKISYNRYGDMDKDDPKGKNLLPNFMIQHHISFIRPIPT